MAMRDSYTAGFLERTGLAIPPELDPDIPSRRESNLSQADLEPDQEYDIDTDPSGAGRGGLPPAPPATPGTPARSQRAAESPVRSVEDRLGAGLDHARLASALGALAECRDEEERGEEEDAAAAADLVARTLVMGESGGSKEKGGEANPAADGWVLAGVALSFAVVVGLLLLRPRV